MKDLEWIVVQHLESLPADLKAQQEGVIKPKEDENEKTATQKLTQQVGQLRLTGGRMPGQECTKRKMLTSRL